MAKRNAGQERAVRDAHTANLIKVGKPRRSKMFRKKGNCSRTSRSGNGKRLR